MAWLLLLLASSCLVAPFFTPSVALGVCSLLLSLVLTVIGVLMLLSSRREFPLRQR